MITIQTTQGRYPNSPQGQLESRVVFDDLMGLITTEGPDLERIGAISHDYLVDTLGISDPKKLGRCVVGLEWQIPCAPMSEMGISVYKNMFARGFRAAQQMREGSVNV